MLSGGAYSTERTLTPQRVRGEIVLQSGSPINLYGNTSTSINQTQGSIGRPAVQIQFAERQSGTASDIRIRHAGGRIDSSDRSPAKEYGVNLYENVRDGSVESNLYQTSRYSNSIVRIDASQYSQHSSSRKSPYRPLSQRDPSRSREITRQTPQRVEIQMTSSVPLPVMNLPQTGSSYPAASKVYRPLVPIFNTGSTSAYHNPPVQHITVDANRYTPTRVVHQNPPTQHTQVAPVPTMTYPVERNLQRPSQTLTELEKENVDLRHKIEATEQEKYYALSLNKLLLRKLLQLNHLEESN